MNNAKWYYMRDNHTFLELKGDEKDIKIALMNEFLEGSTYGMLCTKTEPYDSLKVHAKGKDKWNEFWEQVVEAINTEVIVPEPDLVEVDFNALIIKSLQELNQRLISLERQLRAMP